MTIDPSGQSQSPQYEQIYRAASEDPGKIDYETGEGVSYDEMLERLLQGSPEYRQRLEAIQKYIT